jgi:ankyrin repeat protein
LGNTPLLWASGAGHYDAVETLVARGADVNAVNTNGDTALHRAAWKNEDKICKFLISKGAGACREKKNKDGKLPLDLARNVTTRKEVAPPKKMGKR